MSRDLLNTALKMKKKMVVWDKNGFKSIGYVPSWSCGWLRAVAPCAAQKPRRILQGIWLA